MPNIGDIYCDVNPAMANRSISNFNFAVGDLVSEIKSDIIYRIIKDERPVRDAVWEQYKERSRYSKNYFARVGWTIKKSEKYVSISFTTLNGTIHISPIFSITNDCNNKKVRKIPYNIATRQLKKIDLLTLASKFASFKTLLDEEVKKLSGD